MKSTKQRRKEIKEKRAANQQAPHWSQKPHEERFAPVFPLRIRPNKPQRAKETYDPPRSNKFRFDSQTHQQQERESYQQKIEAEFHFSQVNRTKQLKKVLTHVRPLLTPLT